LPLAVKEKKKYSIIFIKVINLNVLYLEPTIGFGDQLKHWKVIFVRSIRRIQQEAVLAVYSRQFLHGLTNEGEKETCNGKSTEV
jgi:hypothetical protein